MSKKPYNFEIASSMVVYRGINAMKREKATALCIIRLRPLHLEQHLLHTEVAVAVEVGDVLPPQSNQLLKKAQRVESL